MKKIVSLALVFVLALSVLVGCGGAKENDYTLATGVVVSETLASSKLTVTAASIVTDKDGKIVACRLDAVDYTAYAEGAIVTAAPSSKVTLGEDYDSWNAMAKGDWYKQSAALETATVGKTQAEVAALANANGYAVEGTDLAASCSINIYDLLKAIDNAFKSEHKVTFKSTATAFTAGLAVTGTVKVTENDNGTTDVTYSADFSTAVLVDGKVVAAIIDTAEPKLVNVTEDGAASLSYAGTKREQGDEYDSWSPMAAGRWYAQADAYAATAIGKTAEDIATLASEGVAGCTIYAGGYKIGIEAAVKAAR